jgi:glutathione S-transferase
MEANAPYDLTVLTRAEAGSAEHRRRHPLGRVPVVEEPDGFAFESAALCLHVADSYPEAGLAPAPGTLERALVYQWMFYAMAEIEPPLLELFYYGPSALSLPPAVEAARQRLTLAVGAIEDALAGHEFLVGDRFSVADIVVGEVLTFTRLFAGVPDTPNVIAYLSRLDERPARWAAHAALIPTDDSIFE